MDADLKDLIGRLFSIALVVALAGCEVAPNEDIARQSGDQWECRLKTGQRAIFKLSHERNPYRWGGTDIEGWVWRSGDILACRKITPAIDRREHLRARDGGMG